MTRIPPRINDSPVAFLRRNVSSLSLAALNISLKVFDPRDYGAVGDGDEDDPTDSSEAFYNCALAAEAYALEHGRAQMRIAAEVYMVQDPTTDTVASLAVPSAPLHLAYGNIDIIGYGATLKIGPNGVTNSVLRSFGDRVGVLGLRIDCNATAQLTSKGNSCFEFNGDEDSYCQDCIAEGGYTYDKYIKIDGTPTGGTFTITYNGNTTSALPYNVTAEAMQTALRLLSGLNTVTVTSVGSLATQIWFRIPFAADAADFTVSDSVTPASTTEVVATNHNQGQEHFLGVSCTRCSWINCRSYDCGWTSFRSAGSDELWDGCWAIDHRGNGFRLAEGGFARHVNCLSESSLNSGRSGYLCDPGSSATYPAKRRTKVEYVNCIGRSTANDPLEVGSAVLKLAAADEVVISGGEMYASPGKASSSNVAIRLEDNLRKVVFRDHTCKGSFLFTPSMFRGAPTAQASGWNNSGTSGYVQWTLPASHPIRAGDTIFIQDSDIPDYNRPHVIQSDSSGSKTITSITNSGGNTLLTVAAGHNVVAGHTLTVSGSGVGAYNTTHTVTSVTATTILTNRTHTSDSFSGGMAFTNSANPVLITSEVLYEAGSIGSNIYAHEGVDEVHIRNLSIINSADDTYSTVVYGIENASCRIFDAEDLDVEFTEPRTQKMSCFDWEMPDAGLDRFRLKNFKFTLNTTKICLGVRTATKPTYEIQDVTVTGTPTGGSFTLTLTNYGTTPAINHDAVLATAASNMQTQLRTLAGLSLVTVAVQSGTDWSNVVFRVTFTGTLGNLSQMTSSSSLTGGTPNIAHSTVTSGTHSTQLVTSGKTIGMNCSIVNKGSGAATLIDPYGQADEGSPAADRATLFNSYADSFGCYKAAAVPAAYSPIGWRQGDHIMNSAPGSGARPGWRCIATTSPGTAPSFQQEAALT